VSSSYPTQYLLPFLAVVFLPSCAPTHPVTEAVCATPCRDSVHDVRVVVWSHEPAIEEVLLDWARNREAQVVDPDHVQETIRQNHLDLDLKPGLEDELRHLGRLLTADRLLVGIVMRDSRPLYVMYSGYTEGHPRVTTVFDPTVTVRSLGVDPPIVYWSVTAKGPAPTFSLEPTARDLTQTALRRVTCEADQENQWTDEKGCVKKQ
jgi:hypothetical protein